MKFVIADRQSHMKNIEIDINKLLKETPSKKLFTGRSNGEKAYQYFHLETVESDDEIKLIVPPEVVVSSSYFLGMLERIMRKYEKIEQFKGKIDSSALKGETLQEFYRAINRGFYKNTGLF
jgi:hypothetical protein